MLRDHESWRTPKLSKKEVAVEGALDLLTSSWAALLAGGWCALPQPKRVRVWGFCLGFRVEGFIVWEFTRLGPRRLGFVVKGVWRLGFFNRGSEFKLKARFVAWSLTLHAGVPSTSDVLANIYLLALGLSVWDLGYDPS